MGKSHFFLKIETAAEKTCMKWGKPKLPYPKESTETFLSWLLISSPLKDYYNQVDSLALPNDRQN